MQTLKLKQNLNLDLIIPVVIALVLAILWYFFWIKPRNEFLYAVMDCMGDQTSEAAYLACARIVEGG